MTGIRTARLLRGLLPIGLPALAALFSAGVGTAQDTPKKSEPPALQVYAAGIFSAQPSSTEGALTLLLPIGARGIGMGRAVTTSTGAESVFWNPAGLARMEGGSFNVYRGNHLAGEATGFSLLLGRQPLGFFTLPSRSHVH